MFEQGQQMWMFIKRIMQNMPWIHLWAFLQHFHTKAEYILDFQKGTDIPENTITINSVQALPQEPTTDTLIKTKPVKTAGKGLEVRAP